MVVRCSLPRRPQPAVRCSLCCSSLVCGARSSAARAAAPTTTTSLLRPALLLLGTALLACFALLLMRLPCHRSAAAAPAARLLLPPFPSPPPLLPPPPLPRRPLRRPRRHRRPVKPDDPLIHKEGRPARRRRLQQARGRGHRARRRGPSAGRGGAGAEAAAGARRGEGGRGASLKEVRQEALVEPRRPLRPQDRPLRRGDTAATASAPRETHGERGLKENVTGQRHGGESARQAVDHVSVHRRLHHRAVREAPLQARHLRGRGGEAEARMKRGELS